MQAVGAEGTGIGKNGPEKLVEEDIEGAQSGWCEPDWAYVGEDHIGGPAGQV
jgi:hypothetical protein